MIQYILKFIDLFFGYPLYMVSFIILRDKKKIVIGSHTPFNDNSKYFYLLSQKYLKDYRVIWITPYDSVSNRLKKLHLNVYKKNSFKGLYHSLTAKYYIYSFHLPDINFWTSGRVIKINLWHGIPLKDIAFAAKSGPSTKIYDEKSIFSRFIRPHVYVRPDYMVTTSDSMSKYFSKAFRISEQRCLEYGLSRCDIFSWAKNDIIDFIKRYESEDVYLLIKTIDTFEKTLIYMPTWREEKDFFIEAGFDFERLNKMLKKNNALLLFKLHPFTKLKKINLQDINKYSNMIVLDKEMDVYPILPFTDALISDYSSIYYDYLLLDKPVYLFPFDYKCYVKDSRSLAFSYEEKMPGPRLNNFEDFIELFSLDSFVNDIESKKISIEYFGDFEGNSVQRLSNFIDILNKGN